LVSPDSTKKKKVDQLYAEGEAPRAAPKKGTQGQKGQKTPLGRSKGGRRGALPKENAGRGKVSGRPLLGKEKPPSN